MSLAIQPKFAAVWRSPLVNHINGTEEVNRAIVGGQVTKWLREKASPLSALDDPYADTPPFDFAITELQPNDTDKSGVQTGYYVATGLDAQALTDQFLTQFNGAKPDDIQASLRGQESRFVKTEVDRHRLTNLLIGFVADRLRLNRVSTIPDNQLPQFVSAEKLTPAES